MGLCTSKSEAAKRLAPILDKETAKTSGTEWLRYTETIQRITPLVTGFELTDEQAEEMKRKMSERTSSQLSRDSVCRIEALDVRTGNSCSVTLIKKSQNKLILELSNCTGCHVGMAIDFDFRNTFWNDDSYRGCDRVFYAPH